MTSEDRDILGLTMPPEMATRCWSCAAASSHDAVDLPVHVRSERAGERARVGIARFIERRLKLKVNREKSTVKNANQATILGFGFHRRDGEVRIRIAPKAPERRHQRVRKLTARTWSIAMDQAAQPVPDRPEQLLRTSRHPLDVREARWLAPSPPPPSALDGVEAPKARRHNLIVLGSSPYDARRWAGSGKGPWRMSGSPPLCRTLNNRYWDALGLQSISARWRRLRLA